MRSKKIFGSTFALLLCLSLAVSAADKKSADKKSKETKSDEASRPSYELPQPATENLDLSMYQRIRDEGLLHSHVMEFASALADGIGPLAPRYSAAASPGRPRAKVRSMGRRFG